MCLDHEPVGCPEIAERVGYSPHTVRDWSRGRSHAWPPFPPPVWRVHGHDVWDWPLVAAWFERTHVYVGD